MNKIMDEENIIDLVLDNVYSYYESDHSLRSTMYNHPMFYNGTFSLDNSYQPEEVEPLLTKEEFINKITKDENSKWNLAVQVLYIYISKENNK